MPETGKRGTTGSPHLVWGMEAGHGRPTFGKTRRLVALCVCLLVVVSGLIGVTAATAPPAPALPSGFQDNEVWSDLLVPTELAFAPDGQVFVAEKGGTIKRFDSLTDTTPSDVADLSTKVHNWADRGLLGLAVDPNFSAARPYIYVQYSYDHILGSAAPRRAGEPRTRLRQLREPAW